MVIKSMWNQCWYMVCEDIYTSTVEWVFAKCGSESNRSTNGDEIISEGLFVSHSSIVVLKMTYHHLQVPRWQPHTKCHRAGRHRPARSSQHPEAQEHTAVWLPLQIHRKLSNSHQTTESKHRPAKIWYPEIFHGEIQSSRLITNFLR